MRKKITITVDKRVYDGLHRRIKKRGISQFIEDLVRPHVLSKDLDAEYRRMAGDKRREKQAAEWAEEFIGDLGDESR